jgi:uncharacterized protein
MTGTQGVTGVGLHLRSLCALCAVLVLTAATSFENLPDAVRSGDAEQVRDLLRGGADVNAAQGDGMTALHWAAEVGNAEISEILIRGGAKVGAVTRLGDYTPLHLASRKGRADVMAVLLEGHADPNAATTSGGSTPLHFAASAGSVEGIDALLAAGAAPNARESSRGQTPLMFAAADGRTQAVLALLAGGADASLTSLVVDVSEQSAADQEAGKRRDEELDRLRAEAGPVGEAWRPTPSQVQAAVHAARATPEPASELSDGPDGALDAMGRVVQEAGGRATPPQEGVGAAAADGESPGYVGAVGTLGGMTALLHAVRDGHVETAAALLDAGADIDQPSAGDGTAPLSSALINGHFDLALGLLERGADPNQVNAAGVGPLFAVLNTHWAPKARYPQQQAYNQQNTTYLEVAERLLAAGADPNQRLTKHVWFMEYTFSQLGIDMTGATPFWRAAHALDVDAMKLLVLNGADPNIPTVNVPSRRRGGGGEDPSGLPPAPIGGPGVYAIHAASGHGYGTGFAGNSHRYAPDGWMPTIRYLVEELGVDVNARDATGYTAIHNAAARGDTEMISYLVEQGGDVMVVSRRGQTTTDMANGPQQRTQPFPEAIELLMSLGAQNSFNCVSCQ